MQVVEAARSYIGVPWRHLGRSRRGLDCAGLLMLAVKDSEGVELEAPERYGRDPFNMGLQTYLSKAADLVWSGAKGKCTYEALMVGDGVLMAPASLPRHLAIVGDSTMYRFSLIHADGTPGVGKVVEHGLNDYFLKMIVAVYRRKNK